MTTKELHKMLDTTRRKAARDHGFRQSSYINFKVEKGYFFCLYFSLEDARLEVKPMYADDLWWEIWEATENKREPLSFRGKGAFALSGQVLSNVAVFGDCRDFDNIDILKIYERVFNDADSEIEHFLSLNPDADLFMPDDRRMYHDPDRLLYLMALIHSGDKQCVLSIIKEARHNRHKCMFRNGLFEDSYTYIRRWCKPDGLFDKIDRYRHHLENFMVKTETYAVMSMRYNLDNNNDTPDLYLSRIFVTSILCALILSSLILFNSFVLSWIISGLYLAQALLQLVNFKDKKEKHFLTEYRNLPMQNKRRLRVITWSVIIFSYLYQIGLIKYASQR